MPENTALNIGDYSSAELGIYKVFKSNNQHSHSSGISSVEEEILKQLSSGNPTNFNSNDFTTQDLDNNNGYNFKNHVLVNNELNDANVAITMSFNEDTDVSYNNSEYHEKLNLERNLANADYTNVVELGADTAPLYNGNLLFEYSDGDSVYTSNINNHYMRLDTTDKDYNLHKAMNSTLSNTGPDAENGFVCSFNNEFNNQYSIYSENYLSRDSNNRIFVEDGSEMGYSLISNSDNILGSSNYGKLDYNILSSESDNHPLFGSLKFQQNGLQVNFPFNKNNLEESSTLSQLLTDTDYENTNQDEATSVPPLELDKDQFQGLFTEEIYKKIAPGYSFKINITAGENDGYSMNENNNIDIPIYNDDGNVVSHDSSQIFVIDDNELKENIYYMKEMLNNNYFINGKHKLIIQNGALNLIGTNSNPNLNLFSVSDGVEKLVATSTTSPDFNDLGKGGKINVKPTSNELNDILNRRFEIYADASYEIPLSTPNNVNRLVVNYFDDENDYITDVGVISEELKENYYVQSEITVLASSTMESESDVWNTPKDIALNSGALLVFQETSNSMFYRNDNVSEFNAEGLSNIIQPNEFAMLSINKTYDFTGSDESPLFRTSDKTAINGVNLNVSLTNLDLNNINGQDLRVKIYGKTKHDMPNILSTIEDNTISFAWYTGDADTGNLSGNGMIDSNNSYITSEKSGYDYLGVNIYDIFKLPPSDNIAVTYKLLTSPESLTSKDILKRYANIEISIPNHEVYSINVNQTDNDFKIFNINEITSSGVEQALDGLTGVLNGYKVYKYITTKIYNASIRNRLGPYKNLWLTFSNITEVTEWYQLINTNKNGQIMPDHNLINIQENGQQKFKALRYFIIDGGNVSEVKCNVNFKPKDLMGFKLGAEAEIEIEGGDKNFYNFPLGDDPNYGHSLDPMYDFQSEIILMNPYTPGEEFARMYVAIDTPMFTTLGSYDDISQTSNPEQIMYMINLSVPRGSNSFTVTGYKYKIDVDSPDFNKNIEWSPYAVGDDLFINKSDSNEITNLKTLVSYIDPTPNETTNVDEVNKVKVTILQGDVELLSFVSNKYILENFNVIFNREPIIQHDFVISKTDYNNDFVFQGTEYLHAVTDIFKEDGNYMAKLLFGEDLNGVRVELSRLSHRGDNRFFRLLGDRLQIQLIRNEVNSQNSYSSRYSSSNGEEILPSLSGNPLPTDSMIHRNIYPKIFRGYSSSVSDLFLTRKPMYVKFAIFDSNDHLNNNYVDNLDMNTSNVTTVAWHQRELKSTNLIKDDINIYNHSLFIQRPSGLTSIGELGIKFISQFSMLPESISSTQNTFIDIDLTPSNYTKVIRNVLDNSINEDVSSNLTDVVLHNFVPFELVATRIKVFSDENYEFNYEVPGVDVYHSPQYIGNPVNFNDWRQINTYSDSELRSGVIIGDASYNGVVEFKRTQLSVSSFTKYAILPKPTARFSAYDITDLSANTPLPTDLSNITKKVYDFDIDITNFTTFQQGLSPQLQSNKPFNKEPETNIPNQYNALAENIGLNNITVGINVSKYLLFRYNSHNSFSFEMTSNKIKISSGVQLYPSTSYVEIFNGYINNLNNSSFWRNELQSYINNEFTSSKKWNLNMLQILSPISQFIVDPLYDLNIYVNGITSFGMGSYYLDLKLFDSLEYRLYGVQQVYDDNTNEHNLELFRYTSATAVNWSDTDTLKLSTTFKPILYKKEKASLPISITNVLTETPYNIVNLIKEYIINSNLKLLTWSLDDTWNSTESPVRFVSLSTLGAVSLQNMLTVTKDTPYKIFTAYRPDILNITSADGSSVFRINNDGRIFSNSAITKLMELIKPITTSSGPLNNLGIEYFASNIIGNNEL